MLPVALAFSVAASGSAEAAAAVVRNYYAAIQNQDYRHAWAIFANGHSLPSFRSGYAQTRSVRVRTVPPFVLEGAAGSIYATIPVKVDARLRSGVRQHFIGNYTLRRVNDVAGSTPAARRWHLISGHLRKAPAGDQADGN